MDFVITTVQFSSFRHRMMRQMKLNASECARCFGCRTPSIHISLVYVYLTPYQQTKIPFTFSLSEAMSSAVAIIMGKQLHFIHAPNNMKGE